MSEERAKTVARGFWTALVDNDVETMLSYCNEDLTVSWGPYTFNGVEEVRRWAEGLICMFQSLTIVENGISVDGSTVKHVLSFQSSFDDDRRGMLPTSVLYGFVDGMIEKMSVTLSPGTLYITREQVSRLFGT
jgi:hypothetical protein